MKALLLCAGRAERFKPYSLNYSKMTIPFLNTPIISYPLKILEDIHITDLVVNTHHHPKQVESTIKKLNINIQNIHFSYEPQLLGGAGSLKKNQTLLEGDDFIYFNGDSIFLCDDFFLSMKMQHKKNQAWITFLATPLIPKGGAVIQADSKGRIGSGKKYFFPGFALINSKCFSFIKNTDQNIFKDLVVRFPEKCFLHIKENLKFFEAGSLPHYLDSTKKALHILFNPSLHQNTLKKVLNRFCPLTHSFIKNKAYVLCGNNIQGIENVTFQNFAVIGDGCSFFSKTFISDGVLGPGISFTERKLFHTLKLK